MEKAANTKPIQDTVTQREREREREGEREGGRERGGREREREGGRGGRRRGGHACVKCECIYRLLRSLAHAYAHKRSNLRASITTICLIDKFSSSKYPTLAKRCKYIPTIHTSLYKSMLGYQPKKSVYTSTSKH